MPLLFFFTTDIFCLIYFNTVWKVSKVSWKYIIRVLQMREQLYEGLRREQQSVDLPRISCHPLWCLPDWPNLVLHVSWCVRLHTSLPSCLAMVCRPVRLESHFHTIIAWATICITVLMHACPTKTINVMYPRAHFLIAFGPACCAPLHCSLDHRVSSSTYANYLYVALFCSLD